MIAKPEHLFLCDYPVSTLKGTGSGLVQHVTCKEFHMERILLCGSETREKRKLLLLLWHKRPLCPGFLFLFLICNHFLTDVHVACFLISSPMLTSVNGQACTRRAWSLGPYTWAHAANRSCGAWCWPARPDGTVQPCVHASRLPGIGGLPGLLHSFSLSDQSPRRIHKR